jgi:hypothetical protein
MIGTHKRGGALPFAALAAFAFAGIPAGAQAADYLGSASSFGVLAGTTVTNTGDTLITGDLGVSPGTAITGFPTVTGTTYSAGAIAAQAQADLTTAYNTLAALPSTDNLTGEVLGTAPNASLPAGIYRFDDSAQLTGNLVLNGEGNANALFVFQIGSTLTTSSFSSVTLINGAASDNVYWQVGSSATLGTSTTFRGSIVALTSISLTTNATIEDGRALARNGAVTLDTNRITVPITASATAAPEPGSLALLLPLMGTAGILLRSRRRK